MSNYTLPEEFILVEITKFLDRPNNKSIHVLPNKQFCNLILLSLYKSRIVGSLYKNNYLHFKQPHSLISHMSFYKVILVLAVLLALVGAASVDPKALNVCKGKPRNSPCSYVPTGGAAGRLVTGRCNQRFGGYGCY